MITERDRARLKALLAIVKPANSLVARIETLTDDQREHYDNWAARYRKFINENPNGKAYELAIDGFGPSLPTGIREALFGNPPQILNTDGDEKAAQIYRRYIDG